MACWTKESEFARLLETPRLNLVRQDRNYYGPVSDEDTRIFHEIGWYTQVHVVSLGRLARRLAETGRGLDVIEFSLPKNFFQGRCNGA